jgi:hypothetical protein
MVVVSGTASTASTHVPAVLTLYALLLAARRRQQPSLTVMGNTIVAALVLLRSTSKLVMIALKH